MDRGAFVLALDLGLNLGFAVGCVGAPSPEADILTLNGGVNDKKRLPEIGSLMNQALNGLEDLFDKYQPDYLGVEDAIPQRDNNHDRTARITLGLHALTDMVAHQHGMTIANGRLIRPSVDRVRKQVCGRARRTPLERAAKPKITVKQCIVDPFIARVGWQIIDDHNARDAAVLWAYCSAHIRRDQLLKNAR